MGQEISTRSFCADDFRAFEKELRKETALLARKFEECRFVDGPVQAGCELEAWLVDRNGRPAPINDQFLNSLGDPLVVPELSTFNVEFNVDPVALSGACLGKLHRRLETVWTGARMTAGSLGIRLMTIGILPTVRQENLTLAHMSPLNRYFALNERILAERKGAPLRLRIDGPEPLDTQHDDVMLEAAATSFQIHLQVTQSNGVRFYNASKIASAPLVAVSVNSPFLFGHRLWEETRIPLFEQSVSVGSGDETERVTFGLRYLDNSLMDVFTANAERYCVLLPLVSEAGHAHLPHLRLHNGTIWRWNRVLIGFDGDDRPHLRLEQRVAPAGPTLIDCIANAAFFYGVVHALAAMDPAPETQLSFEAARDNFYRAARFGLDAEMDWCDTRRVPVQRLVLDTLLPAAERALRQLGLDDDDITLYLGVIERRVATGQTGAHWQRAYAERNGGDMYKLCAAYYERQESAQPVHEWSV